MSATRVLLVEDNPADARLLAELLSEVPGRPFALTAVGTLAAALECIPEHEVVLLDLSLPDAHGLSTVERLTAAARSTPIVVLTGTDDERVALEALEAGAQDYLLKAELSASLVARSIRYAVARKRVEAVEVERARSDKAALQARFLARVAFEVTRTLALDAALGRLSELVVPLLGDLVIIYLDQESGGVTRAAAAGVSQSLLSLGAEMDDAARGRALLKLVREHGTVREARDSRSAGGALSLLEGIDAASVLATPLVARERIIGAILYVFGPSGRRHEEDEQWLGEEVAAHAALAADNASLFEKAQQAIRGRDNMLAVVSHDLRNPLEVMSLALALLGVSANAEQGKTLARARRALGRMKRLIDDLLDVARIDAGTLRVEAEPIDLAEFLEEAYEIYKPLATEKEVKLLREIPTALGRAWVDRHRMAQVLSNLLDNALKFTPAGGSIRLGAVGGDAGSVGVFVQDSGPGIAPENVSRVFDRFWQKERNVQGVGLGLAIAKGIVEAHGGSIHVESQPEVGATFRIKLRAVEGADAQRPQGVSS